MGKLTLWNQEEDQIIKFEFTRQKSRKWKTISKILSQKGFQRGQSQCRQRYVNHLNPALDKDNDITQEQLQTLYCKYDQHGPKWCLIQAFIPNRTQIKIKNVFYGNIRFFLKKLYKFFAKKTAVFINSLKTNSLQSIYSGTQEYSGFTLMKKAFKKFYYKISQQNCLQVISSNKDEYLELLNKILQNQTRLKPLDPKFYICQQNNLRIKNIENKLQFTLKKKQESEKQTKKPQQICSVNSDDSKNINENEAIQSENNQKISGNQIQSANGYTFNPFERFSGLPLYFSYLTNPTSFSYQNSLNFGLVPQFFPLEPESQALYAQAQRRFNGRTYPEME